MVAVRGRGSSARSAAPRPSSTRGEGGDHRGQSRCAVASWRVSTVVALRTSGERVLPGHGEQRPSIPPPREHIRSRSPLVGGSSERSSSDSAPHPRVRERVAFRQPPPPRVADNEDERIESPRRGFEQRDRCTRGPARDCGAPRTSTRPPCVGHPRNERTEAPRDGGPPWDSLTSSERSRSK